MGEWYESRIWFRERDDGIHVVGAWPRETYIPASVIDAGDRGVFMVVDQDLLGSIVVRFACRNGYAHYNVEERMESITDSRGIFTYRKPVYRLRLAKARKVAA